MQREVSKLTSSKVTGLNSSVEYNRRCWDKGKSGREWTKTRRRTRKDLDADKDQ